ncbi:MAG: nuclear transport factor 2 family protein [Bryobacterales bacterium]|nr:nuclear transport factor 2 family protein [Acidobacteriota bacterium]MCB9384880.1 nuclear transport factor 2 family protein [Bryobacterales bacterium]
MTAEQQVLAALEAWKTATIAKDGAALDALLHAEIAYSHSNCHTESKDDILSKLDRPGGAQAIEFSNAVTRVAGDTAFVKADVDYTNRRDGEDSIAYLNVLHVFVNEGGKWCMFARQATRRP